jgi:hypothetical protein
LCPDFTDVTPVDHTLKAANKALEVIEPHGTDIFSKKNNNNNGDSDMAQEPRRDTGAEALMHLKATAVGYSNSITPALCTLFVRELRKACIKQKGAANLYNDIYLKLRREGKLEAPVRSANMTDAQYDTVLDDWSTEWGIVYQGWDMVNKQEKQSNTAFFLRVLADLREEIRFVWSELTENPQVPFHAMAAGAFVAELNAQRPKSLAGREDRMKDFERLANEKQSRLNGVYPFPSVSAAHMPGVSIPPVQPDLAASAIDRFSKGTVYVDVEEEIEITEKEKPGRSNGNIIEDDIDLNDLNDVSFYTAAQQLRALDNAKERNAMMKANHISPLAHMKREASGLPKPVAPVQKGTLDHFQVPRSVPRRVEYRRDTLTGKLTIQTNWPEFDFSRR